MTIRVRRFVKGCAEVLGDILLDADPGQSVSPAPLIPVQLYSYVALHSVLKTNSVSGSFANDIIMVKGKAYSLDHSCDV